MQAANTNFTTANTKPAQVMVPATADTAPTPPRLLLASRSPRRRALLEEAGLAHDAVHPGFEDGVLAPGCVTAEQWVASLAYLKAWVGSRAHPGEPGGVVIGADTACLLDGQLIGTPTTEAEAAAMLDAFENRAHDVITGVAVIDRRTPGQTCRALFVDRATVEWGTLTPEQKRDYLASGAWQGKAGAYNLRDRLDAGWPITFRGDPGTIMGLPMRELMRRFGPILQGCRGAA